MRVYENVILLLVFNKQNKMQENNEWMEESHMWNGMEQVSHREIKREAYATITIQR